VNQIDRSGLIRLTDAEAAIPGPPGPHSVSFLQRGTLNVKLSLTSESADAPHSGWALRHRSRQGTGLELGFGLAETELARALDALTMIIRRSPR